MPVIRRDDIVALGRTLAGCIHLPGSDAYEELRLIYAIKVTSRPALFVHAASVDDVRRAVAFARDRSLPLAIRCGGHSYAGHGLNDGGLVIDMSGLRSLAVAVDRRTIVVGGGALVGMIDRATTKVGRATVLGQCRSVGVGGFALGGGVGTLMSGHGLGCDNIVSATVVLADGRVETASAEDNSDLFWALRGGGGNFGVVTSLTLQLHPVSEIVGGFLNYRMDRPGETLRRYRDAILESDEALTVISRIVPGPGEIPFLSVQATWNGSVETSDDALRPLRAIPGLVMDGVISRPYIELQAEGGPAEIPLWLTENRSGFVHSLTDAVVDVYADAIAIAPPAYWFELVHLNGAVTRVSPDATAFPLRTRGIAHSIAGLWSEPEEREAVTRWVDDTAQRLAPHEAVGTYVNTMDASEDAVVRAAYGASYERLSRVKTKYDPTNVFSCNQNIKPTLP